MSKPRKQRQPRGVFTVDGREYRLHYTLPLVRAIRKELDADVLTHGGVNRITGDVIAFAEYVWFSVANQAERHGVDEESFIEHLPNSLDRVVDAWLEAVSDFFEQMGRAGLAELARALVETERAERAEANRTMTRSTAKLIVDRQLTQTGNKRRRVLSELLGDENEDDDATHGRTSGN